MSPLCCSRCGARVETAGSTICNACWARERKSAMQSRSQTPAEIQETAVAEKAARVAPRLRLAAAIAFLAILALVGYVSVTALKGPVILALLVLGAAAILIPSQVIRPPRRHHWSDAPATTRLETGIGRALQNTFALVAVATLVLVSGSFGLFVLIKVVCTAILHY